MLLVALLWGGIFMGATTWMTRAQRDYLRRYRAAHGLAPDDLPLSEEMAGPLLRGPGAVVRVTWRKMTAFWERQADPEVEQARREVIRRMRVTLACGLGGWLLFVVLGFLGPF